MANNNLGASLIFGWLSIKGLWYHHRGNEFYESMTKLEATNILCRVQFQGVICQELGNGCLQSLCWYRAADILLQLCLKEV